MGGPRADACPILIVGCDLMTARGCIVGILGGMGPAATVDLFARIVDTTPAQSDQEHLHILIENNPEVPDRTAAILERGPDPLPLLKAGARKLEAQGAELIAIPCNTAHYFLPQISSTVNCQVLDMIEETVEAILERHGSTHTVGVLATTGTLACGLYQRALSAAGLKYMVPNAEGVDLLMQAIYGPVGVKTIGANAQSRNMLQQVCFNMSVQGADLFLLGCTELPLVLNEGDVPETLVASNQVLAEAVVREALQSPSQSDQDLPRQVATYPL